MSRSGRRDRNLNRAATRKQPPSPVNAAAPIQSDSPLHPEARTLPAIESELDQAIAMTLDESAQDAPLETEPTTNSQPTHYSDSYQTLVVTALQANTDVLESNTSTLNQLINEVLTLRESLNSLATRPVDLHEDARISSSAEDDAANAEQVDELLWQIRQQEMRIAELERESRSLEEQNHELAARIASQSVRSSSKTATSCTKDALSWDERKLLILEQMEDDTFDAESFTQQLASLRSSANSPSPHRIESATSTDANDATDLFNPLEFVEQLIDQLNQATSELQRKEVEIGELRCLLEQQGGAREGNIAVGAAAIAQLVDSDDLIREERERLKEIQAEWEEKLRQSEIDASLERAKLSRERQELAKRTAELEEELEHLRRECRQAQEIPATPAGSPSRRWLHKLGLSDPGK